MTKCNTLNRYEEQEAQREELQARLKESMAQREQLLLQNSDLSKRVALYYHLKKNDEASSLPAEDAERSVSDKEQRYCPPAFPAFFSPRCNILPGISSSCRSSW